MIEAPEEPANKDNGLTIETAIERYLVDIKATTGERTDKVYCRQFDRFCERRSGTQRSSTAQTP